MEFVWFFTGIIIGVSIGFLLFRGKKSAGNSVDTSVLDRKNAALEAELKSVKELNERQRTDLANENSRVNAITDQLGRKTADVENLEKLLREQKKELEELQQKFTKEFENLANRIFEEKSKKFAEQNKTQIDDILKPLGEKIKDFEKKVNDVYVDESKERASLKAQVQELQKANLQISEEAKNLTRALTGEKNKTAGNWGEMILETILEKSGLVKGEQYRTQVSLSHEDGSRLMPDVIIDLPGNKQLVVDSKLSLVAYERFTSSENEEEKNNAIKEHINSIRKHIKDLSDKNYQKLYSLNTVDFVLLFMPIEPAFLLALQNDRELFNFAFDRNIVIVSPTTLLATLRTVDNFWKQELQNRNVLKIADEAAAMYEKFVGFTSDLLSVGKKMDESKSIYEDAMKKLSTGPGNVVKRIENLKKLGLKVSKSVNQNLIDRSNEEQEVE
jgi:DNA recombination protein RmuC